MLVEVAKPVVVIFCILSLYALFHAAFLVPASDMHQRVCDSLGLLALAATISLIGGFIFRDARQAQVGSKARLTATLPIQLFCWGSGAMFVLFVVSWYVENHCIFYRDVRF